MNKRGSANVYLYLSFLLRIMFVKIYSNILAFTFKHYKLMLEYFAKNLKDDVNILILLNLRVYENWCHHAT